MMKRFILQMLMLSLVFPLSSILALAESDPEPGSPLKINQDEAAAISRGEATGEVAVLSTRASIAGKENPRMDEIRLILEQEKIKLADLENQIRATTDHRISLDLQRRLIATKIQSEVEILKVQLRYAEAAGRVELAEKLQGDIEEILNPVVEIRPSDRPTPERNISR